MKVGNIAKWMKNEGDSIKPGEMIAQIETDKATVDFESQEEGYLAKILLPEGASDIPMGTPVAIMVDDKGDVAAFANYKPEGTSSEAPAPAAASTPAPAPPAPPTPSAAPSSASSDASYPPHTVIGLPALSPTMKVGNIAKWMKKEGDSIKPGEMIAQIETDKATVDFESQEEGYLAKILLPEGASDIPMGTPVAIMVDDKETVSAFANYQAPGKKEAAPAPPKAAPAPAPTPASPKISAPAPAPAPVAPAPKPISPTPKPPAVAAPAPSGDAAALIFQAWGQNVLKSPLSQSLLDFQKKYSDQYGATGFDLPQPAPKPTKSSPKA